MKYPTITEAERVMKLAPPLPGSQVDMVLDTDTYNETDDQFALSYALLSDSIHVEAVYAAPFFNHRVDSPEQGMEESYREIHEIFQKLKMNPDGMAYRGTQGYIQNENHPPKSDAVTDLINRAMKRPESKPLYVVAIGAITNIAAAILKEPEIIKHMVVLWLGGNAMHWASPQEFNFGQDLIASQTIFDCGVPFIHFPCWGLINYMVTTEWELKEYIDGKSDIGSFLFKQFISFKEYRMKHEGLDAYASSKSLWDVATIGWLVNSSWYRSELIAAPRVSESFRYMQDGSRHLMREITYVNRDKIFGDMFRKIANAK